MVSAKEMATTLHSVLLDPVDCWRDVCALRSYDTSDQIALVEMTFARLALIKATACVYDKKFGLYTAQFLSTLVDKSLQYENPRGAREYYGGEFREMAPEIMAGYDSNAFPFALLTGHICARLGVTGIPRSVLNAVFGQVHSRAVAIMHDAVVVRPFSN